MLPAAQRQVEALQAAPSMTGWQHEPLEQTSPLGQAVQVLPQPFDSPQLLPVQLGVQQLPALHTAPPLQLPVLQIPPQPSGAPQALPPQLGWQH
jgi:hypothetical protein